MEYISRKAHYNFEFEHGYTYLFDMYFDDVEKPPTDKIAEYTLNVEMEWELPSPNAVVICQKESQDIYHCNSIN